MFLIVLGIVSLNIINVNAVNESEIQPRSYVADVLYSCDTHIYYVGVRQFRADYNYVYTTIRYVNSYSRTKKVKDISSFGDILGGNQRIRTTYTYKTY